MKPYDIDTEIDDYVTDRMDRPRRAAFEARMQADPELAGRVAERQLVSRTIASYASKRRAMSLWDKTSAKSTGGNRRRRSTLRIVTIALSAAACLAVLFTAGLFLTTGNGVDADPATAGPIFRGGSSADRDIATLMDDKRYDEALAAIDRALADTAVSDAASPEEAEYQRMIIADITYTLRWQQINALIGSDRTAEAIDALKRFVDIDGEYQQDARTLLDELSKK